jgi:hypothetical protein
MSWLSQGVHMLFGATFTEAWEPEEVRENKFVFIGKNLDRASITSDFMACLADDKPLRFAEGDRVRCRVQGGWQAGKVIKVWDEGNPYRVQLESGVEVWGPLDEDRFIRKA